MRTYVFSRGQAAGRGNVDCRSCAMSRSNDISDGELAELIRGDPQRGFTCLLQRYGGRVRGYLRRRFPSLDEADVQDAVTDAMLRLADSFDARRGTLAAWFVLLAHQQAVRVLRSRGAFLPEGASQGWLEAVAPGDDPLAALEAVERVQEVQRTIASLPDLERAVLEADVAAGRTVVAELLAQRLETTVASIYAARRRGRAKLIDKCSWIRHWLQGKTSGGAGHGKA